MIQFQPNWCYTVSLNQLKHIIDIKSKNRWFQVWPIFRILSIPYIKVISVFGACDSYLSYKECFNHSEKSHGRHQTSLSAQKKTSKKPPSWMSMPVHNARSLIVSHLWMVTRTEFMWAAELQILLLPDLGYNGCFNPLTVKGGGGEITAPSSFFHISWKLLLR